MYNFEIPSMNIYQIFLLKYLLSSLKKWTFFFVKEVYPIFYGTPASHAWSSTRRTFSTLHSSTIYIQVGRTGVSVQNSKQVFQSLHRGPTFTNLTKNQHPTKPQGHFNCVVVLWLDSLCVHYHIIFIMWYFEKRIYHL